MVSDCISIGDDVVLLSSGAAEAWRMALATYLEEAGHGDGEPGRALIAALELRWPASLNDDRPPYRDPLTRRLFGEAAVAVARDVACPAPRIMREVNWVGIAADVRVRWIGWCARLAYGITGIDLTDEVTAGRSLADRDEVALEVAHAKLWAALGRYRRERTTARRTQAIEAAAVRTRIAYRIADQLGNTLEHQARRAIEEADAAPMP